MYAPKIKSLTSIICLLIFGNYAFGQSGLSGLAGALDKANSQPPIIKKTEESIPLQKPTTPPQKINTPINVESASINDFIELEKKCRSKDGDSCLYAGKIMMLERPPQELFNLSSTTRINRAIRLYEAAISANDNLEAMELVYDLYFDNNLINRELNSYTDKDRAKELFDQMLAKNYPGGQIRQARMYIEDPEYLLSISKKKEACSTARRLASRSDLSPSTDAITKQLLSGNTCLVF
jgi:hypothetical protein